MAQDEVSQDDRTEEATPERRDDFRERGQVVVSREITSVVVLAASVLFLSFYLPKFMATLEHMFVTHFESIATRRIDQRNLMAFALETWLEMLFLIFPIFIVTGLAASAITFAQTRLNWSWKRLKPDFSRINILEGSKRLVSMQALVELAKGIGKMFAVGLVAWLILKSEWVKVPSLMNLPLTVTWGYWGEITRQLFWAVATLLLVIAGGDYLYNFLSFEKKLKMTKQEVKEETKKREVDPHLKGRMRRLARDFANRKTLEKTKDATVLITNPTHFSIALRYEMGMGAPIVVAKGIDHLALKMREVAKDRKIPIIENRPLARELYATVEEGQEIPDKLYKVVAEIIRYIFKLKGQAFQQSRTS